MFFVQQSLFFAWIRMAMEQLYRNVDADLDP